MIDQDQAAARARQGMTAPSSPSPFERLVKAGLNVAGLVPLLLAVQCAEAQTTIQPLPQNAPHYLHFTYPSAMSAPLPNLGTLGQPLVLGSNQSYSNSAGQLGVVLTQGTVVPANNAFFQSLGSNGRSCFTCHQPSNGMSISTNTLQALFIATGGRDPVFAPVDGANCPNSVPRDQTLAALLGGAFGLGQQSSRDAHSLLLNKGLFRIFLPVPRLADFTITVVSDPYGCNTDAKYSRQVDPTTQEVQQMISVYRRPRMSANLKFVTTPGLTLGGGGLPNIDFVTGAPVVDPATGNPISGNIMWDGREPTLQSQAISATLGHAQATKPPTAAQVAQIVSFESGVFAAQSSDSLAGALSTNSVLGGPQPLSAGASAIGVYSIYDAWPKTQVNGLLAILAVSANAKASIARGEVLFNTRPLTVGNVAGFNNASLLGVTNPTSTTCASCHGNMPAGNDPFPAGQRDIGIGGHAMAFGGPAPSPDLPIFRVTCKAPARTAFNGTEVLTNDPGLALISGKCADVGRRSVPQLRALAARGPFFSDGSAASITDVVKFYDKRFGIGLTATDVSDLANFLEAL